MRRFLACSILVTLVAAPLHAGSFGASPVVVPITTVTPRDIYEADGVSLWQSRWSFSEPVATARLRDPFWNTYPDRRSALGWITGSGAVDPFSDQRVAVWYDTPIDGVTPRQRLDAVYGPNVLPVDTYLNEFLSGF